MRTAMLKARDKRIEALEGSAERLESNLKERTAMLKARDKRIEALEGSAERLESNLKERTATLKARDKRIEALEGSADRLESNLKERTATLKARDKMIDDLHNSTSWKITAPLRALSRCIRWLLRNLRRAIKLFFWLSAGQFRAPSRPYATYGQSQAGKPLRARKQGSLKLRIGWQSLSGSTGKSSARPYGGSPPQVNPEPGLR